MAPGRAAIGDAHPLGLKGWAIPEHGSSSASVGDGNDLDLQGAICDGLVALGVSDARQAVTVQVQWRGPDLVARIRWDRLAHSRTPQSPRHFPVTETRRHGAAAVAGPELLEWARWDVTRDGLALAFAEVSRYGLIAWPPTWPVPLAALAEGLRLQAAAEQGSAS